MIEFLTIGEPLYGMRSLDKDVDLEHAKKFERYLAGAEVGISIGMSRLGFNVGYISRLGNDVFSKYVIEELKKNNIKTDYISIDENRNTAFQLKSNVSEGDPIFGYLRKQSAGTKYPIEKIDDIDFSNIKLIHITGLFAALSNDNYIALKYLIKTAKLHGITITFDPNLRPQLWASKKVMKEKINSLAVQSDIVLPGIKEGQTLTGLETSDEIADYYLDKGIKGVITKLGPEGAHLKYKNNKDEIISEFIPGFVVDEVVDTVGAGDGFAIGVISGLMLGHTLPESTERGVAIGALAVTTAGDSEGYPTEEKLQEYLNYGKRWGKVKNLSKEI